MPHTTEGLSAGGREMVVEVTDFGKQNIVILNLFQDLSTPFATVYVA